MPQDNRLSEEEINALVIRLKQDCMTLTEQLRISRAIGEKNRATVFTQVQDVAIMMGLEASQSASVLNTVARQITDNAISAINELVSISNHLVALGEEINYSTQGLVEQVRFTAERTNGLINMRTELDKVSINN